MSKLCKLGYSGTIIKAKDYSFCIQKQVAELLKKEEICISFDKEHLEIIFYEEEELKSYLEKRKKHIGETIKKKPDNELYLNDFKAIMLEKAQNLFKKKNISFYLGRINKLKKFKLDGVESNANLEGVKNSKENLNEIINGRKVWILGTNSIKKRTISSTNPEYKDILTNEDDRKVCEISISIMKNELANLKKMDHFSQSLEFES